MHRQILRTLTRSFSSFTNPYPPLTSPSLRPELAYNSTNKASGGFLRSCLSRQFHSSSSVLESDYYDVLGVPRTADEKDIKRAYHRKALELHPDRNKNDPNAQEKFQEVQKAYATLSNPKKRRVYDQLGSENFERMENGGGEGATGFHSEGHHQDLHSIFEQFSKAFGGGGGFGFGADSFFRGGGGGGGGGFNRIMMQDLRLSFMEAVKGAKKKLRLDPDGPPVEVEFPPGIDSGQQLIVEAGTHSQVILTIQVDRHPIFQRKALDLYINTKIDMVEAALGGTTHIPTLEGDSEIAFNEGTQHGDKLRLRGKGVRVGQQRGDLFVVISIAVPSRLTNRQRQLLLEFSKEEKLKKAA